MTFKKAVVWAFFLNVVTISAFAQNKDSINVKPVNKADKKFYYQMGFAYNFFAGIGARSNSVTDRSWNYTQEYKNSSFGKGFDISFGMGAQIAKNLALELEVGYLVGAKDKTENQYYDTAAIYPLIIKEKVAYKANCFRVNPKFVFEVPLKNDHAFYSKIGYMVGFGKAKASIEDQWYFDNGWYGEGSSVRTYTGGIVSGSTMALGFRFATKEEDTYFFMEATGANLHRKFRKGELTEVIANGQNNMDEQPPYYMEHYYVDKAEYSLATRNLDEPRELAASRVSYSSIGIRMGFIKYF